LFYILFQDLCLEKICPILSFHPPDNSGYTTTEWDTSDTNTYTVYGGGTGGAGTGGNNTWASNILISQYMGNTSPKNPRNNPALAVTFESSLVIPSPPKIIPTMDRINAEINNAVLGTCIGIGTCIIKLIIPKTIDIIPYVFAISITLYSIIEGIFKR